MTTAATKAFGTKLYRGSSGTPRTGGQLIEELSNIDLPEAASKVAEVTSHDSTKGEHINTYVDEGEISIEGNYVAGTGQELLRGTDLGGAAVGYYVNLAGGSGAVQIYFSALVTSFKLAAPMDGQHKFTAKLKITGAVTWTTQS